MKPYTNKQLEIKLVISTIFELLYSFNISRLITHIEMQLRVPQYSPIKKPPQHLSAAQILLDCLGFTGLLTLNNNNSLRSQNSLTH